MHAEIADPPGADLPPEQTPPQEQTLPQRSPPLGADIPSCAVLAERHGQQADGTHPTGMHTCLNVHTIIYLDPNLDDIFKYFCCHQILYQMNLHLFFFNY